MVKSSSSFRKKRASSSSSPQRSTVGRSSSSSLPLYTLLPSVIFIASISASVLYRKILLNLDGAPQDLIAPFVETAKHHARNMLVASSDFLSTTTSSTIDAKTIGYFISVTGCGKDNLVEGAAVLKHSIHLASRHGPSLGGTYDYKMHAIYHPAASECVAPLADLGYELIERDVPVQVSEIQGDFLRSRIATNGCCGEKELIKLEAYTFTQFPLVVHLDLDALILKPLDPLFDAMLMPDNKQHQDDPFDQIIRMWPDRPRPPRINAMFTRDYFVVNWNIPYKAVQGGFLILRPDRSVYEEYVEIIKEGDFREGRGWGGKVGPFYGAMTVQGLLAYYYDVLHPGEHVDLHHCVYNQMSNNPRDEPNPTEDNNPPKGKCRTGETDCEDCRLRPLEDIVSVHFTNCQKPWFCLPYKHSHLLDHKQCRKVVGEWYRMRSDMEQSWGRSGMGPSGPWREREHFYGYCMDKERRNYVPIAKPYGQFASYHHHNNETAWTPSASGSEM